MHDFCFTIPYGLILIAGGFIGYAKKGSVSSLGGGVGAGLLLIIAGFFSLKAFEKRGNSVLALILETAPSCTCESDNEHIAKVYLDSKPVEVVICRLQVIAGGLTFVMGQRYLETSKIMPAGIITGISALMTVFYGYKIATGGNHFSAKAE